MPTKYIAIGIAALIIAAGAYFYFTSSSTAGPGAGNQAPASTQTGSTANAGNTFTGSLADLVKRGGDFKCTFTTDATAAQSSGVVYISGTRVRGDFASTAQGINVESHMIQDAGYVYVWSPLMQQGLKAKAAAPSQTPGTGSMSGQGVNQNQSYAYNCSPWSVDASVFALPAGVTFAGQ